MKGLSTLSASFNMNRRPKHTFRGFVGPATAVLLMSALFLAVPAVASIHAAKHSPDEHHSSCAICIAAQHSGDCLIAPVAFFVATTPVSSAVPPFDSVVTETSRLYLPVRGPPVSPSL